MPTMIATSAPHDAATAKSRPRREELVRGLRSAIMASQRPVQDTRTKLHDGHNVKQQHQRAERKRDGDRAPPAPALLFLGENDTIVVVAHDNHIQLSLWSISRAAKIKNR